MNDNYFEKCHLLMNKLSKQNKQMIQLQVDFADLKKENEQLKEENKKLKLKINTYHEGNKTLHQTLQRYWEKK